MSRVIISIHRRAQIPLVMRSTWRISSRAINAVDLSDGEISHVMEIAAREAFGRPLRLLSSRKGRDGGDSTSDSR